MEKQCRRTDLELTLQLFLNPLGHMGEGDFPLPESRPHIEVQPGRCAEAVPKGGGVCEEHINYTLMWPPERISGSVPYSVSRGRRDVDGQIAGELQDLHAEH